MSAPEGAVGLTDLAAHPFLAGLSEAFLRDLLPGGSVLEYDTGATIVREGEPADEFFLLVHGKVALEMVVHDRPRLTVLTLGPGEVLGWSWLAAPHRWRADARALKPTRVLGIAAEPLRRALESHPTDGYRFLSRFVPVLAQRLDATRLQVLDVHRP